MLNKVKLALRIAGNAYDDELNLLISACLEELEGLNVIIDYNDGVPASAQVQSAVIAYCKWQFGDAENKEQFERIYHTKLAQLKTMTGHTNWGVL